MLTREETTMKGYITQIEDATVIELEISTGPIYGHA